MKVWHSKKSNFWIISCDMRPVFLYVSDTWTSQLKFKHNFESPAMLHKTEGQNLMKLPATLVKNVFRKSSVVSSRKSSRSKSKIGLKESLFCFMTSAHESTVGTKNVSEATLHVTSLYRGVRNYSRISFINHLETRENSSHELF